MYVSNNAKLQGIFSDQGVFYKRLFLRTKHMSACIGAQCTTVIVTVLTSMGICDFSCARYNVNPPNLQKKCDGFLKTFSDRHALSCSNGVLVVAHHNYIRDNIIHLSRQDLSPNCIRSKPLIHLGRSRSEGWRESRQDHSRNMVWHVNQVPMGDPDRHSHWRQVWMFWHVDL